LRGGLALNDRKIVTLDMRSRKPLHELTLQEQAELVTPVIAQVQQDNLEKGLYNIYQPATTRNIMVHEYRDHTEEVSVSAVTGRTRTVKRTVK
jgi:thiamine phosphate synthase YjbQ (UPF0047 family)